MPGSYFRTAWRHLQKDGSYAGLNIFGLAIGLAVCLLITLFVADELSYDRYNEKADRIYRIVSDLHMNGNMLNSVYGPAPLGAALVADYPSIEKAVRIRAIKQALSIQLGHEKFIEHNCVLADPSLFDVFTLPMISGNPHMALVEPYSMVISEKMAKKYFTGTEATGKTLMTDDSVPYTITGVIADMPANAHFHFDFIKSMAERQSHSGGQWVNFYSTTYLLVKAGVGAADIDRMLKASVQKYLGPELQQEMHSSLSDLAKNGDYFRFYAMPLTQIHLHSNVVGEFEPNGRMQTLSLFIVIAALLLLIACANFMNLSTARSADRSREVGVRKVLGSSRRELMAQFLTESVLTSFIAGLGAVVLAVVLLPYFNRLSGKHLSLSGMGNKWMGLALLPGILLIGLLAGSYPAVYLSSFQPIKVLKGGGATGGKSSRLRNILVIFQFATALILIIGTLVVYRQLNYIRSRDVGYNRDQVLTIQTNDRGMPVKAFKEEVEKLPGIVGSTMTSFLPDRVTNDSRGYFTKATAKATETVLLGSWKIDVNYVPLLGMKIVRGRNFSPLMPTDSSGILINEAAARQLRYPDPLRHSIFTGPDQVVEYHIIGVVKDFNAGTMRSAIEPIVFHLAEDNHAVSFRVNTRDLPGLVADIKKVYRSVGGQVFNYSFLDDDFNKLYEADERTGKIFLCFSLLTVVIACLGLFGLATYAAEQRTKEIGIRKVLGATVRDIAGLLSRDFLKLVLLAILIGCPIGWWAMHRWLEDFAYRTVIGWWEFVLAGGMVLAITIFTVGWRAVKAGRVNPVESLRGE